MRFTPGLPHDTFLEPLTPEKPGRAGGHGDGGGAGGRGALEETPQETCTLGSLQSEDAPSMRARLLDWSGTRLKMLRSVVPVMS